MTLARPHPVQRDGKESDVAEIFNNMEGLFVKLRDKICGTAEDGYEADDGSIFRFASENKIMNLDGSHTITIKGRSHSLPDPKLVKAIIKSRSMRSSMFGGGLFADPAWDMILDLILAQAEYRRVSISSLCIASGVPSTTALRWIAQLVERGIFERTEDVCDKRRVFITLSDTAIREVARYFGNVEVAAI